MFGQVAAAAALACVAGAAYADIRHFEIPDGWSIAVAALFAVFAVTATTIEPWWEHAAAGAIVFFIGALLFDRGWLGGGDVKLLAACALWAGFSGLPLLLLGTVFAGGAMAVIAVVGRKLARPGATYPAFQYNGPLPYAVAILGGAILLASVPPLLSPAQAQTIAR
ncbi:prepilin peptidase [Polymorphobacter sp. PAMC 29334]|uniref:A24 family peptidase n=1 Tax=Polymorphobacter sp. PAMC 29334 TaxID=2862331 RepID=UPI001D0264AA|nr:prepilin peptidase [Polymorphobacter sp. PAMC 29334]